MFELSITFAEAPGGVLRATLLVGRQPIGTGVFLPTGTRDVQFVFETEQQATDARQRVVDGMTLESATVREPFELP